MDEKRRSSMSSESVCVKPEPETVFNEQVHVKEEAEYTKVKEEWDDSGAALAVLYADHEVKDELVLGPEGLQPPDIVFTLCAAQALDVRKKPVLWDCMVRLERIDDHKTQFCTDTSWGTAGRAESPTKHVKHNSVMEKELRCNTNINTEKESYKCDICETNFTIKTRLMEHVMMTHIHQSTEQEESGRSVTDNGDNVPVAEEAESVKEEAEWAHEDARVKDEPEWEDAAPCGVSAAAALYAGHAVKGELVLGPEGPQPPDVVFVLRALAMCGGARSRVGEPQLALRDCTVRHERVGHGSLLHTDARRSTDHASSLTSQVESYLDIKESRSNINIIIEETHVCDICKEWFPLKTELMEHAVVHVHAPPDAEQERLADNARLALRACSVRLERGDDRRGPRGPRGGSLASCTRGPAGEETGAPQGITTKTVQNINAHVCDTCGETFLQKYDLIPHLQLHLRHKTKQFPNERFRVQKQVHARKRPFSRGGDPRAGQRARGSGLSCEYCSKQFAYLSTLITHRRTHTGEKPYTCETCKKVFTHASSLKQHTSVHTGEKPYSCRTCGKRFRVKNSLRTHEPVHTVQRPHSCDTCGKGFANVTRLKVHKRIHTGEKPYSCKICKKEFTQSSALKAHERFHTGERRFSCDTCQQRFTQLGHLKTHERIHAQEKPYPCKTCKKSFTRSDHLKKHERIHTGEKPYACGICAKKFADSRNFTKHQLLHTGEKPHSCEVCKATFAYKGNLKKHERVHTGAKPYSCGVCARDFAMMDTLRKHLRTHTREKPYSCGVCSRAFARRSALRVHARAHARAAARTQRSSPNRK